MSARSVSTAVGVGLLTAALAVGAGAIAAPASGAGQVLTVTPSKVEVTQTLGGSSTVKVTVTNTSDNTKEVTVAEVPGELTTQPSEAGAKPMTRATKSLAGEKPGHRLSASPEARASAQPQEVLPAAAPWTTVADYPVPIMDNLVDVFEGAVYSVAGVSNQAMISDAYRMLSGEAWEKVAPLPQAVEMPSGAFIDGKLYVTGGWTPAGGLNDKVEAYDPVDDSWSTRESSNPDPLAAAASAVLDGKLYLVGGCDNRQCGDNSVQVYDPAADSWKDAADYPEPIAWSSCGAIDGKLYCAGGMTDAEGTRSSAYAYTPGTDSWAKIADMPAGLWAAGYTAANGELLISGGEGVDGLTNVGYSLNARSGVWDALPPSGLVTRRGGSACGFYRVGGSVGDFGGVTQAELLPGYDACGLDVPWMSVEPAEFTLQPGASADLQVTLTSESFAQPGTYTAALRLGTADGDAIDPVPVTLTVVAPKHWGALTGRVTSACDAKATPIGDATVVLKGATSTRVLRTDADGRFTWELAKDESPVTVVVSKDDWRAQSTEVRVKQNKSVAADFSLTAYPVCAP
ncbi:Kelch repeat-containing protein [Microbacterium sp. NPDC057650]|uniref:Kelch repeat-containing protein n=1 Tax=unclassified Microbacterium TaxID=2609290 RepID=UPI00366E1E30